MRSQAFWSTDHLCDEAVAAYVDGVMSQVAQIRADKHLAQCPECRQQVVEQRAAQQVLQHADVPGMPQSLTRKLEAIPLTTDLLASIAETEGDAAAARFAKEHNIPLQFYETRRFAEVPSTVRSIYSRIRCKVRRCSVSLWDCWQRGYER